MDQDPTITTALAAYEPVEAKLAEIRAKYEGRVYDVSTADGLKTAKAVTREINATMIDLEKRRKAAGEKALRVCQGLNDGARRLKFALSAIHDPIEKIVRAEEQRLATERAEAERKEAQRVAEIQARIAALYPSFTVSTTARQISDAIDRVEAVEIDASFAEFEDDAYMAKTCSINRMRSLLEEVEIREHEREAALEAARKAEEENRRLREQLAEQERQEQARLAAEELERQREIVASVDLVAPAPVLSDLETANANAAAFVDSLDQGEHEPTTIFGNRQYLSTDEAAGDDLLPADQLDPERLAEANANMSRLREVRAFAPLEMSYDYSDDSLIVAGVKYAGSFFRNMANCPIDGWLKVVSRDANGCMQIYQPTAETSRSIDDWLAQVEIDNSDD